MNQVTYGTIFCMSCMHAGCLCLQLLIFAVAMLMLMHFLVSSAWHNRKLTVRYFTACALQATGAGIAGACECQLASSALLPYLTPKSQQVMSAMLSHLQQVLLTGSAENQREQQ